MLGGGGSVFTLLLLGVSQCFQTDGPRHGLLLTSWSGVPTEAGGKGQGGTEGHVPQKPSLGRPYGRWETEAQNGTAHPRAHKEETAQHSCPSIWKD